MIKKLLKMDPKTRWFAFNWAIYLLILIVTTLYSYFRL